MSKVVVRVLQKPAFIGCLLASALAIGLAYQASPLWTLLAVLASAIGCFACYRYLASQVERSLFAARAMLNARANQRQQLTKKLQKASHQQGLQQLKLLTQKLDALSVLIGQQLSPGELTHQRLNQLALALHQQVVANLASALEQDTHASERLFSNEIALTELDQISARLARIQQDQASWPLQEAADELAKTLARLQRKPDTLT